MLRAVIYPDSDDSGIGVPPVFSNGPDGIYDRVEHRYNRQGQATETKDQNETVHTFDFDKLGRQIHDRVIALGTNIDGAVRRISTTHEVRGQLAKITSYDNATVGSGNVVNEVLREYNELGLLAKEYQEHDGAKDSGTLYVGYNYDDTASGGEFTKGLRPTSIRYPNGRLVHYSYGSPGSDADNLNRLDAIKDDSSGLPGDTLASYTYLGLGQMVIEDLQEPQVKLDYFGGTSGTYAGFDRFDRIVDQRWYDYGASEDRDRFKYGYDRASNRTWKENTVSKNLGTPVYLDEFYSYDGVNRLKNMDRGELNGTRTGISGTPSREEDWTLDPLGNWSNYLQKTSGTTDLDQDRAVNKANEITDVTETVGTAWATPSLDRNGNMTSIPQPVGLGDGFECIWDGWNRLVTVEESPTRVAKFLYDGLDRRVTKDADSVLRHIFYSRRWQVLEERVELSTSPDRQFLWGPFYIDQLILRERDTSVPANGALDERSYAIQDANWNVTSISNKYGTIVERNLYAAYGVLMVLDPDFGSVGSTNYDWEHQFSGRSAERTTGIYDLRSRWFHQSLGCFLTRDAMAYFDSNNFYSYVNGQPTLSTDPLGWYTLVNARKSVVVSIHPKIEVIKKHDRYTIEGKRFHPCPCCILVWVHGYNNDLARAKKGFASIETAYKKVGGACEVYGFAWRGDIAEDFVLAKKSADLTGEGPFSKFIRDFKASCPKTRIHLAAHSLGARVVLVALKRGIGVTGIDQVLLVSAAVDNEVFEKNEEFESAPKWANRIHVYWNHSDDILQTVSLYSTTEVNQALGKKGVEDLGEVVHRRKITQWGYPKTWGDDHSAVGCDPTDVHLMRLC